MQCFAVVVGDRVVFGRKIHPGAMVFGNQTTLKTRSFTIPGKLPPRAPISSVCVDWCQEIGMVAYCPFS